MLQWNDLLSNYKKPHNIWYTGGKSGKDDNLDHACNRVHKSELNFSIVPKFTFSADTSFFTIGSCFARNIELALIGRGVRVNPALLESNKVAARESLFGDAALLHRFNAPSMLLEIENYTNESRLGEDLIYPRGARGCYWDCHYANNQTPRPVREIMEDRIHIRSAMSAALAEAGCAIITLGLSEAVYDKQSKLYLNSFPPKRYASRSDRFAGAWISAEQTLDSLQKIRTRMHAHAGRPVKIIITVSPVGLHRSFSGHDILVANMLSKSQLRVAAAQFSDAHDDVDYFPSYEMVMLSDPSHAWQPDGRHVNRGHVRAITDLFCDRYLEQS
ncbi:MAG: hypothetical protein HKN11_03165 [Rhizobiales bacterium]|nr:hypothetical protein [Hyphomicrobiales bacterium]